MDPVIGQGALAIVIASLAATFALGFQDGTVAVQSVRRIRDRRGAFRFGGLLVVVGVVLATEADAVMYWAGRAKTDAVIALPLLGGYLLLVLGVAALAAVVWWPERAGAAA